MTDVRPRDTYDYDAPISEAGDYGQPGIGGPLKDCTKVRAWLKMVPIPAILEKGKRSCM